MIRRKTTGSVVVFCTPRR